MQKNEDPLLDFEQFKKRRNSFHMFFVGRPGKHLLGDAYRSMLVYRQCTAKHTKEFGALAAELRALYTIDAPVKVTEAHEQKLYEAYKLMHPYATNNAELFT